MVDVANPSLFRKEKVGKDMHYFHCDGEYVIRKLHRAGYKRRKWSVEYIGPTRGPDHEPIRGFENTVGEMMKRVEEYYIRTDDAKERVIRHIKKGEDLAAADALFDYIDNKFSELEDKMDNRFERLRISSGGSGDGYGY